jgi:transcriptional regulator with XRE-family HTH domain
MKLKKWAKDAGISLNKLADMLKVTQPAVLNWTEGRNIPRKKAMGRIKKLTNNQVTEVDFYT